MNYLQLLSSLATSTHDSWCLIEYPGPIVQVCSLGLQHQLQTTTRHGLQTADEEKRNQLLAEAFLSVWRVGKVGFDVPLKEPVGNFDHLRIVRVSEPDEADVFLVHWLQRSTANEQPAAAIVADLSPRQADVLNGVYAGETNKSIGSRLGISQKTVEKHRAKVMERLEVGSLAELVRLITVLKLGATTDPDTLTSSTVSFSALATPSEPNTDGYA